MTKKFKGILVSPQTGIKDVLEIINQAPHNNLPSGIALIVDDSNSLLGIVTDGDFRRAILNDISLDDNIITITNKNYISVNKGDSKKRIINKFLKNNIQQIIVLDNDEILNTFYVCNINQLSWGLFNRL